MNDIDLSIFKCPTCELILQVEQLNMTDDHGTFICPSCLHLFDKAELRNAIKEANMEKEAPNAKK